MPRFGTKSLLVACAVAALWFSTFAGYAGAADARASLLLLLFVASGLLAVYREGKQRAFWAAFFAVMLLCGGNDLQRPLNRYVPSFVWTFETNALTARHFSPTPAFPMGTVIQRPVTTGAGTLTFTPAIPTTTIQANQSQAISATIAAVWTIVLATLGGCVGAFICNRKRAAQAE